jgi:hypothetical protein
MGAMYGFPAVLTVAHKHVKFLLAVVANIIIDGHVLILPLFAFFPCPAIGPGVRQIFGNSGATVILVHGFHGQHGKEHIFTGLP